MILVYPMLTSGSVSPNVLPGIIKAVEKYILLYNTDAVLKAAGATSAGQIVATGGKAAGKLAGALMASQDNTLEPGDALSEAPGQKSKKPTGQPINIKFGGGDNKGGGGAKPSLDIPRGDAISLEPTWLQVTTKKKGLQILGVKVVPFRVKSAEAITKLIANDKQLKALDYLAVRYGRGITRVLQRVLRKVPLMGDQPVSGDAKKDILLGKTQYNNNMFLCMSQMDIENEEVFNQPGGIQRLHRLGWASFIIVDDVNRRTTFCMKEFGGVCSVVPYNFMFTSFGKDYNQAYDDLEDIKKASGPFFNMRTNRRRIFSEASNTTDKYLQLIQGK